jgi:hypothetical protein
MRRTVLLSGLLAACAGLAETTIYAGPVTPEAGVCDPQAQGELTQRGTGIVFSADSGTLVLQGKRSGNDLAADLTLLGIDKKPFTLTFTGAVKGQQITGTYTTQRCRYRVTLKRTND